MTIYTVTLSYLKSSVRIQVKPVKAGFYVRHLRSGYCVLRAFVSGFCSLRGQDGGTVTNPPYYLSMSYTSYI